MGKGRSENRIILIHSNVRKSNDIDSFKCQKVNNTLQCTVFQTDVVWMRAVNSMDEKFFLKKIEVTKFIGRLFPSGQSKIFFLYVL